MNFQSINSQEKEKASIPLVITKALMQNGESDLIEEATKNPEKIHEVTNNSIIKTRPHCAVNIGIKPVNQLSR